MLFKKNATLLIHKFINDRAAGFVVKIHCKLKTVHFLASHKHSILSLLHIAAANPIIYRTETEERVNQADAATGCDAGCKPDSAATSSRSS